MDQVTLVKNQVRAQNWCKLIEECQNSGQTVVSWCKENDVNIKTYYYWLRKFRQQEIEKRQLPVVAEIPEKPVKFQRLEVHTPVPNTKAAIIIRMGGATVEVSDGTSQQTIQAVPLALQSVC